MRWGIRAIGFLNTLILARLLTPGDFGIVAMGSLIIGILDMFSNLQVGMALIRRQTVSKRDCDTVWTIRLAQHAVMAGCLCAGAPLAAAYFNEPRLPPVVYALALGILIQGGESIGIVLFRRDFEFAKDFRFGMYSRLLTFAVTVPAALIMRNYWALVLGQVVGGLFSVLLSYRVHAYRPGFSFEGWKEYVGFAVSIVPMNVGRYVKRKVDVLAVGRIGNTAELGSYNVASELSTLMTTEFYFSLNRAVFPGFAAVSADRNALKRTFLGVLGATAVLSFPIGVGLALVAEEAVLLLLGTGWLSAVPLVRWLSISVAIGTVVDTLSGNVLIVIGRERLASILSGLQALMLGVAVVAAAFLADVVTVAQSTVLVSVLFLPIAALAVSGAIHVSLTELSAVIWRPVLASAAMAVLVQTLALDSVSNVLVRALIRVPAGASAYVVTLLLLWWVSKRPEGVEGVVWRKVVELVSDRRRG